jgi:hypothetical protein
VCVQRLVAIAVVDDNHIAITQLRPAGKDYQPIVGGVNGRAGRRAKIDPRVPFGELCT